MGKIYTRCQIEMAQKPYPLGRHVSVWLIQGSTPPPGGGLFVGKRKGKRRESSLHSKRLRSSSSKKLGNVNRWLKPVVFIMAPFLERWLSQFNPGLIEILSTVFLLRACNSSLQNTVEPLLWDTVMIYKKCYSKQFKVDRLQIILVATNIYIYVSQLFISRMPKMRAIPQLVSAPLNPIPVAEHFRRSHPPREHSHGQHIL